MEVLLHVEFIIKTLSLDNKPINVRVCLLIFSLFSFIIWAFSFTLWFRSAQIRLFSMMTLSYLKILSYWQFLHSIDWLESSFVTDYRLKVFNFNFNFLHFKFNEYFIFVVHLIYCFLSLLIPVKLTATA